MGFLDLHEILENGRACRTSMRISGASLMHCLLLATLALAGCRSLHLPNAALNSDQNWLTEGGNETRAFSLASQLDPPLETTWVYNAASGFGPGSPLIVNGAVVVATRKGEIHAIDLRTGKSAGVLGVGESVDGTPVIEAGILYVPVSWGRRGLHAYDLTRGTTLWRDRRVPVRAGLLLQGTSLIAADVESRVISYESRSGERQWERVLSERSVVHAAPVALSSTSFAVADDAGMITALSTSDGSLLWETEASAPVYNAPAVANGRLFVPTTRGVLEALDAASGRLLYRIDLGNATVRVTTPAADGELVVFGTSSGSVTAADAVTGETCWTFNGGEALGGAPLIAGEHVFIGDMARRVRALNRQTGELVWETEVGGRIKSSMAAADGYLVVLAEPRSVYLFRSTGSYALSP